MPVTKVIRQGVGHAPRQVPTDTTTAILPMTFNRVGQEAPEDEDPAKVSSLADAFKHFKPKDTFKVTAGEEGTEFVADLEFNTIKDFDPKQIGTRVAGKRNDIADLQSQVDLLHRMRESFSILAVKRAWENEGQRSEIIDALQEFRDQLQRIAGGEGADK